MISFIILMVKMIMVGFATYIGAVLALDSFIPNFHKLYRVEIARASDTNMISSLEIKRK